MYPLIEATEETSETVDALHSETEIFQCRNLARATCMYIDEMNQRLTELGREIFEHAKVFATHELAKQLRKIVRVLKGLRTKANDLFLEMKKFESKYKQVIGNEGQNQT